MTVHLHPKLEAVIKKLDNSYRVKSGGITLLTTYHYGIAKIFVEMFNNRGSDFDLETGEWL